MKRAVRLAVTAALLVILITVSLTACGRAERYYFYDIFGTFLEVDASGSDGKKFAEGLAEDMRDEEKLLSAAAEDSDIGRINAAGVGVPVKCSELTMELISVAHEIYLATDGAYDPSVYPLVKLWGFAAGDFVAGGVYAPPSEEEIEAARALVGFDRAFSVDYENSTVTKLIEGAALDLGGVAKGGAVERAIAKGEGRKMLVNLGGNIGAAGGSFTVGVGNPRPETDSRSYLGTFTLLGGETVTTSGDYERYFVFEGKRYHHIIDPATGCPADSGLVSATVITVKGGTNGAAADALATAMMIVGKERALELAKEFGVGCVLVESDLSVTVATGDREFKS